MQKFRVALEYRRTSIHGFLLRGEEELLEPYKTARNGVLADLDRVERSFRKDPARPRQVR